MRHCVQHSTALLTRTTCNAAPTCLSPYFAEHPMLLPPTQQPVAPVAPPEASSAAFATALVCEVAASHSLIAASSTSGSRSATSSAPHLVLHVSCATACEVPPGPNARRHIPPTCMKPRAHATSLRSSRKHGATPLLIAHSRADESNSFHPGQQRAAPPGRPEQPAPPQVPQIFAQHAEPSLEVTPLHETLPRRLLHDGSRETIGRADVTAANRRASNSCGSSRVY